MKKWMLALFVLCTACTSKEVSRSKNATLCINIQQEPSTLDPGKARDLRSLNIIRLLFDGLMRMNKEEQVEFSLAEKVAVSEDGKTYTFFLRETEWSCKEAVTAEDFAYAWKRVLDPAFLSDNAFQLYPIKNAKLIKEGKLSADTLGIEVIDNKTLKVELEHPVPYFLDLLVSPIFFPVYSKDPTIGNGPFRLKQWKHANELVLEKNPSYWDASSVHLPEVKMVMVGEETALMMFEKKELDWVGSPFSTLPQDALKQLKSRKEFHSKPLWGTYFYRVNTAKPGLNNVHIRKALALAIQRKEILEHVTAGGQIPAMRLIPAEKGPQFFLDGDKENARALFQKGIEELKQKGEKLPTFVLSYSSSERNHLIAQAIQQQWQEVLGIQVQLQAMELKVLFQRVSTQDYELAAGSWIADIHDPVNFLEVFKHKTTSTNNTNWERPEYAHLLDLAAQIADAKKRQDLLHQGEELLMNEMPIIPIFHYTMNYLKQDRVKDEALSSLGNLDLKWARLSIQ